MVSTGDLTWDRDYLELVVGCDDVMVLFLALDLIRTGLCTYQLSGGSMYFHSLTAF